MNLDLPHSIDTEARYQAWLRECYGSTVEICGQSYDVAYALREVDPTAYDVGMSDWLGTDESIVEFEGDYYDAEEFQDAVEERISELEDERDELEKERDSWEEEREWDGATRLDEVETELKELSKLT